jgi:hypothetical protein
MGLPEVQCPGLVLGFRLPVLNQSDHAELLDIRLWAAGYAFGKAKYTHIGTSHTTTEAYPINDQIKDPQSMSCDDATKE